MLNVLKQLEYFFSCSTIFNSSVARMTHLRSHISVEVKQQPVRFTLKGVNGNKR